MRKTKGYSKGGAKMMKATKGKMMTKGMRKGGVKTAMGGKMMSKGYAKGGTKMMKARVGRAITGDRRPNKVIAKKKVGTVGRAITGDKRPNKSGSSAGMLVGSGFKKFTQLLNKSRESGGKFSVADVKAAYNMMQQGKNKPVPKSRLTKNFYKFKK
tara:strand:- start:2117 stop:2584 length:468 start_codon:yes stop_codon:yes gene_type:complete